MCLKLSDNDTIINNNYAVYQIMRIKVKGENIETMYNIIPYKSKVINVESYILNFSPIIQNRNAYPRKENDCGDDSSMVLLYG